MNQEMELHQAQQDQLVITIEQHAAMVQHLIEEAFPDRPELVGIYNDLVKPAWASFVEELVGRATSQSASASVAFHRVNKEQFEAIRGKLATHDHRLDVLDAQQKTTNERLDALEQASDETPEG